MIRVGNIHKRRLRLEEHSIGRIFPGNCHEYTGCCAKYMVFSLDKKQAVQTQENQTNNAARNPIAARPDNSTGVFEGAYW
jgi:hypothetical protein